MMRYKSSMCLYSDYFPDPLYRNDVGLLSICYKYALLSQRSCFCLYSARQNIVGGKTKLSMQGERGWRKGDAM